jgi:hypothetical protein
VVSFFLAAAAGLLPLKPRWAPCLFTNLTGTLFCPVDLRTFCFVRAMPAYTQALHPPRKGDGVRPTCGGGKPRAAAGSMVESRRGRCERTLCILSPLRRPVCSWVP